MSYKNINTGNTMNDLFSHLIDFILISPRLLRAKNGEEFEIWLEKLEKIDRRSLYFFLKRHNKDIPKEHMDIASRRFWENLYD